MTAELIQGLCSRDQASYQRLIADYGAALYRIALRLTGGQHDAQDVLQETLLTVMAKVDTVQDPAMLGPWLRRVTVNTALMRLRARREEPISGLGPDGTEFTPDGRRTRPVSSWPPLPEDELLRREARGVLEAAVSQLPAGAREVYVLAEIEDLPRDEVSELLGISRDAVRVRLHRGLLTQGLLEVLLAIGLLAGIATPRFAMVAAMMLVMFTVLSPTGGQIRISRDLAIAAAALALAFWGGGRWSIDRWFLRRTANADGRLARLAGLTTVARGGNRDRGLLLIRLGLVYTLAASALFSGGVFDNPMNTSLPQPILLLLAVALATGLGARYLMGGILAWLVATSIAKIASMGLLIGAENVKRELALAVIAAVYAVAGPDRWTLPRPHRLRCREVSELLAAYVDGELPPQRRRAVEFHLADCSDCWAYLASYRKTVELGKDLHDAEMPAEVYERLYALVAGGAGDQGDRA